MDYRSKLEWLREFMASQANHWTFFSVLLFMTSENDAYTVSGWELTGWILLSFMPSVLYFTRNFCTKFLPQFLSYLVFFVMIVLLPLRFTMTKLLFLGFVFYYTFYSLVHSMREKEKPVFAFPPYLCGGITFLSVLILIITLRQFAFFPFCLGLILSGMFYLLTYFIDRFLIFTFVNDETSQAMPIERMFRSGSRLSVAYLCTCFSVLLMIAFSTIQIQTGGIIVPVQRFLKKITGLIRKILGWLIGKPAASGKIDDIADTDAGLMQTELGTPSLFWQILTKLVFFAVAMFLLYIAIFCIYKLILFLTRLRFRFAHEAAAEPEENKDIHEKLVLSQKIGVKSFLSIGGSIEERIRRLFKKKVLAKEIDPLERMHLTAREFSDMENNPDLADLYEKARYSPEECEKDDLRRMIAAYRRKSN